MQFFATDTRHYDLIVAADVLPYFGDLDALFLQIAAHLKPNGCWVFTIEIDDDNPFTLQETGRFSHHPERIKQLIQTHHLELLHQETVVARQQDEHDLHVLLSVACRSGEPIETASRPL
ncbi:MAG: hypothetical protein B7X00_00380 [Legionella sp. 21-45-4]|nr:MAG: hypothetical protein B7X00_00380 [Legionella sp. 21-45-4]